MTDRFPKCRELIARCRAKAEAQSTRPAGERVCASIPYDALAALVRLAELAVAEGEEYWPDGEPYQPGFPTTDAVMVVERSLP